MTENIYHKIQGCQIPALDEIYLKYFGAKTDGHFVEVGAFNGYNWSNTYHLAQLGWYGLLFEPQEQYYNDCLALYKGNERITVVQCCIGDHNGETKLYLGGSNTTMIPEQIEIYNSLPWAAISGLGLDKYVTSPIFTLDYMLEKANWPSEFDLLVIDVEGAESLVLDGFTLTRWLPTLAIVETHKLNECMALSAHAERIDEYFLDHGYEEVYCDHINSIYHRIS